MKNIGKKQYLFLLFLIITALLNLYYFNLFNKSINIQNNNIKNYENENKNKIVNTYNMKLNKSEEVYNLCNNRIILQEFKKNDDNSFYAKLSFNGSNLEFNEFINNIKLSNLKDSVKSINIKNENTIVTIDSMH